VRKRNWNAEPRLFRLSSSEKWGMKMSLEQELIKVIKIKLQDAGNCVYYEQALDECYQQFGNLLTKEAVRQLDEEWQRSLTFVENPDEL
jgi:hypothetical protein